MGDILQNIVKAIGYCLNPTISSNERQSFQNTLMLLKDNPQCAELLSCILEDESNAYQEPVHIMSLSILHDWLKMWWEKVDLKDKLYIRNIFSKLLAAKTIEYRSKNYRNKFSSILAEISERLFPQYWASMIDDFKALWTGQSFAKQEIILSTLRFLYTDCADTELSEHLSSHRRQEIMIGLCQTQDSLLELSYKYLTIQLEGVQVSYDLSIDGMIVALELIQAMISVVNPNEFVRPHQNFFQQFLSILSIDMNASSSFKIVCAETIQKFLCQSKFTIESVKIVLELFATKNHVFFPKQSFEYLAFMKMFGNGIIKFVAHNIAFIFELISKQQVTALILDKWFMDLLACYNCPSRRLVGETLVDLCKIYKFENFIQYGSFQAFTLALLEVCFSKIQKPAFLGNEDWSKEEWFEIEFNDTDEWVTFHGNTTSQYTTLISLCCERSAETVMEALHRIFIKICKLEDGMYSDNKKYTELQLLQVENSFHLFNVIYHAMCSVVSKSADSINMGLELHNVLIQWNPKDSSLVRKKLKIINSSSLFLRHGGIERMFATFNYMFFVSERLKEISIADGTKSLNYDSIFVDWADCMRSLVKNGLDLLKQFPAFVDALVHQIRNILDTIPMLPINQSMREILMILSPYVGDIDKLGILKYALFDFFEQLRSHSVSLCQNETALFTAILNGFTGVDLVKDSQFILFSTERREPILKDVLLYIAKFKENIIIFNSMIQALDDSIFDPWISESFDYVNKLDVFSHQFPVLALYLKFVELCFTMLRNIHALWNPSLVSKFISGSLQFTDNTFQNNFFYGFRRAEFVKYVKGVADPMKFDSDLWVLQEQIKDEIWELTTFVYKVLGDAVRKNSIAFSISVSILDSTIVKSQAAQELSMCCESIMESIRNIFLSDILFLDHLTFVQLVKYFVEPLCVDIALKQVSSRNHLILAWFTETMKLLFTHINFRLVVAYNAHTGNIVESMLLQQIKLTGCFQCEEHFYHLLYQKCLNLSIHQTDANMVDSIRDGMKSDLQRTTADLLSTVLGNRGPLKVILPNKSNLEQLTLEDVLKIEKSYCLRYNFHQLFFQINVPSWLLYKVDVVRNDSLGQSLLSCLLNVIRFPDSSASRIGLCLVEILLHYAVEDSGLAGFVCKELNAQLLMMLLNPEKWSTGLETEILDNLLDIYRVFVIGTPDTAHSDAKVFESVMNNQDIKQAKYQLLYNLSLLFSTATPDVPLSTVPREQLVQLKADIVNEVIELESKMFALQSRKKQKEVFKEFFSKCSQQFSSPAKSSRSSKFSDLPRIFPVKKENVEKKNEGFDGVGISSLFD